MESYYPDGYWWQEQGKLGGLERRYRDWVLAKDQLKFVLSVSKSRERLLDIGCGNGTFVRLACVAGLDAYGLDDSTEAVRAAREQLPERFFLSSERERLVQQGRFHTVTLFHTLEHIASPLKFLRSLHDLMHRPGKLIVQVPNNQSLQAKILGSRWYGYDCPRHICNYNTDALIHLLGRAGYRVRKLRHFSLRDNAAALVSSLFPVLDPMSLNVRKRHQANTAQLKFLRKATYFGFVMLAQPLAVAESFIGRGATVTVCASLDGPVFALK